MSTFSKERRAFIKGALGGALAAMAATSVFAQKKKNVDKPNIIFILADDLGYGDIGCYGQKTIQTPRLDKMAAEGMLFTQHYSGSTVCAPSRCALMTGLHMGHARIRGNGGLALLPDTPTVARLLARAGYATALIGKWGLGNEGSTGLPRQQGFDYFRGYLSQIHAHNYYPEFLWRNEEKVPLRNKVTADKKDSLGGVSTNKLDYSHDIFASEALAFIERERRRPFFLYLPYTIPHANNQAGKAGMETPSLAPYSEKEWPDPQKGHAAMITRMDADIGRLLDKLKELDLDERTLVIFSSDNGPHREGGADPDFFNSSGPLRGIKRDLYEGGIRVPTLARWPGKITPGAKTDLISAFWDFLPTACEVAGADAPKGIDGISYLPELLGQPAKQQKHPYLFWEFYEQDGKQAIRMGDWKGVRTNLKKDPNAAWELYNLGRDLGESENVAARHPEIVARIEAIALEAHVDDPNWRMRPKPQTKAST